MNIPEFTTIARFSSEGALNNNFNHTVPTKLHESWAGRRLIEALNQLPPSKFGSSTDIRFQQKQLLEREQRKMEMTAPKKKVPENSDNELIANIPAKPTTTKSLNSSIGNGKVRQMFNERRRGVGIDRSHPLKPITSRSSSSSSALTVTSSSTKTIEHNFARRQETTALRPINGRKMDKSTVQKHSNGNDSVDYNINNNMHETNRMADEDLDSETFPDQQLDSSGNFDTVLPSKLETLALDNCAAQHEVNNNNPMSEIKSKLSGGIKLNPVLTKKSPPAAVPKISGKPARTKLQSTAIASQTNSPTNTTQKPTSSKPKIAVKSSPKMAKPLANSLASKWLPKSEATSDHPEGTTACRICSRFFNEDRISKHEEVCEKMAMKQRKIFDASKHRVKGTEAEKFLKKVTRGSKTSSLSSKHPSITPTTALTDPSKKSNWRKKHEEFIAAIRAAKEVQAHLAKGGKLSDLPPPPRSENPDYITCPHCSRRFNEAAANRHIPKCANMIHNKPKPAAKRR